MTRAILSALPAVIRISPGSYPPSHVVQVILAEDLCRQDALRPVVSLELINPVQPWAVFDGIETERQRIRDECFVDYTDHCSLDPAPGSHTTQVRYFHLNERQLPVGR